MARMTAELIVSLVDQATAPARAIASTVNDLERAQAANRREMDAMRGQMLDAAAAGIALAKAIGEPIQAAMEFESAMADVRKVVNFDTDDGFAQMREDILDMSTVIPMAATEIAAIVAAAGQAGMAGEELLAFAEMAAKVGVAFDISADRAGTALAEIKTALRLSVGDTQALADAINHLSNNMASSAPDVLDFMQRVGSAGKLYGFTTEQTAAIGSAMIAAGSDANVAGTSFLALGRSLARGESATGRQIDGFERLGLSATDVARRLQEDAVGTLEDVLSRIRELPDHLRATTLSDIFGEEARAVAPLIDNAELLGDAIGLVADRAQYLGSSQEEYAVRAETAANAAQLFKNQIEGLSIAIGSALLPAMVDIMAVIGPYLGAMADLAAAHPDVVLGVIAIVGGLVSLRIATLAARWAMLFLKGALIDIALVGARAAGGLLALLNPLNLVRAAMVALRFAVIGTGIGAILVAIAMAGLWIYENWDGLTAFFEGFGSAVMGALDPIMPAIRPIIDGAGAIVDTLIGLTGPLDASEADWRSWGVAAGQTVAGLVEQILALPEAISGWFGDLFGDVSTEALTAADWTAAGHNIAEMITSGLSGLGVGVYEAAMAALPEVWDFSLSFIVNDLPGILAWLWDIYATTATIAASIGVGVVAGLISWLWQIYRDGVNFAIGLGLSAVADILEWLFNVARNGLNLAASIRWPEPPGWLRWIVDQGGNAMRAVGDTVNAVTGTGAEAGAAVGAMAGARAIGGAVAGGRAYLVGEEGPELFTPGGQGYISTAAETSGLLGRRGGSVMFSGPLIESIQITKEADADAIIARLEEKLREALSGIQADIEWAG